MANTSELACTYAALILHDDGIEITAEKIAKLVKAANVDVESYWPSLFAKLCQKKNIDDLIMNVGASGDAAATVSTNVPAATKAVPAAEETKKKKEEVKEESEDDMVFGLFD
ncbi:60S acidic ribosomal protein family [Raphanus sativus]|uniref:60S acidic ribosomal protein P1-like n=1 Tax=Raphanus sativus TaxID=3726 RepID=A0A9W3CNM4_RAPSA|nr:60S acidic ribosomal protein P1-like [Raphanus sativus]XP_056858183.1 60S acidic ribosomal protein P1-like [Raphanus sativus]KAJ4865941.1 60S acidic ribosomal protein family [Raphanus sativus]KAJ4871872.1 60S acidic ribosomal protein family [Raphanus sativus]